MKCLRRNGRLITYANYVSTSHIMDDDGYDTGETKNVYTSALTFRGNLSSSKGYSQIEQFGNEPFYDRVIVCDDVNLVISENSILFIDVTPNNDLSNYDYIVKRVSRSLNVLSIAIQRVDTA